MRDLLDFLMKYSKWLVFALYVSISLLLLSHSVPYQRYVLLTSANAVSAGIYGWADGFTSYFHLRKINDELQAQNAALQLQLVELDAALADIAVEASADSIRLDSLTGRYGFILARAVSNSVTRAHNYITINKGSLDGLHPEMGVVDQNGVVGIVNVVGPHASRVISLLNPKMRLACKVKGSEHFGTLVWDCRNPSEAVLEEMPRHERFVKGDTVVTSGYSAVFPPGIPVGTIQSHAKEHDDNFYALRIKLFTDFGHLSTVRVITDNLNPELTAISAGEEND